MDSIPNFVCVSFPDENNCLEVIPLKWLCENEKKCFWPSRPGPNLQKLLSRNQQIDNPRNFVKWKVKILKKTSTYEKGKSHLKKLVNGESNPESSSTELDRKKRKSSKKSGLVLNEYSHNKSESGHSSTASSEAEEESLHNNHCTSPQRIQIPLNSVFSSTPQSNDVPSDEYPETIHSDIDATHTQLEKFSIDMKTQFEAFQRLVLRKLASFEIELVDIKKILLRGQECNLDYSNIPTLPVHDREEFNSLNIWIGEEAINREKLVTFLGLIGGSDAGDTTRRILSKCIDHEFQKEVLYSGVNNKVKFADCGLCSVVIDAVRRNEICKQATDRMIEDAMKPYFRQVKDRKNGRKARKNREDNNNNNPDPN